MFLNTFNTGWAIFIWLLHQNRKWFVKYNIFPKETTYEWVETASAFLVNHHVPGTILGMLNTEEILLLMLYEMGSFKIIKYLLVFPKNMSVQLLWEIQEAFIFNKANTYTEKQRGDHYNGMFWFYLERKDFLKNWSRGYFLVAFLAPFFSFLFFKRTQFCYRIFLFPTQLRSFR